MTNLEMITIRELLRDPQFRKFFTSVPELPEHYTPDRMPWRLLVMKKGEDKWRGKRFGTYQEAFAGFKTMLPKIDNAAINCPALSFMPPIRNLRVKGKMVKGPGGKLKPFIVTKIWRPQIEADMEQHHWCPHCRRPTVFHYSASKQRVINGFVQPPSEPALHCMICGASERIIDLRAPYKGAQLWDPNRPKIYNVREN